jgi:zinc protease
VAADRVNRGRLLPLVVQARVVFGPRMSKRSAARLSQLLPVVESRLPNGLEVRMVPDSGLPFVSLNLFYRVGSRNERPGITGISHLFEHMMFNGAKKYGPKAFDRELETRGGTSNAYTGTDYTSYHETFPSEALEKVLDLESDRMRSLAISDKMLKSEREVVKEERRASVDNDINGTLYEELDALAFKVHPYRWPILGWMGDLDLIDREACQRYFQTFYAPNNAVLYLSGDVNPKTALPLIRKYFATIPKGPKVPTVNEYEPEPNGERRMVLKKPAQSPALLMGYHAPTARHPDTPVLDVIQYALGVGEGSRLNRSLVYGDGLAIGTQVDWQWRIGPGLFTVRLDLALEADPQEAEKRVYAEMESIAQKGLTAKELMRAKNNLRAHLLHELSTVTRRPDILGMYEMLLGSWRAGLNMDESYQGITLAQVKEAAARYFQPERRSVITLIPASA